MVQVRTRPPCERNSGEKKEQALCVEQEKQVRHSRTANLQAGVKTQAASLLSALLNGRGRFTARVADSLLQPLQMDLRQQSSRLN